MTVSDLLPWVVSVLCLVVTGLGFLMRLRWSSEFRESKQAELCAKDATIESLREQISFYRDRTPERLMQDSKVLKEMYEGLLGDANTLREASSVEAAELRGQITAVEAELARQKNLVATYEQQAKARDDTSNAVLGLVQRTQRIRTQDIPGVVEQHNMGLLQCARIQIIGGPISRPLFLTRLSKLVSVRFIQTLDPPGIDVLELASVQPVSRDQIFELAKESGVQVMAINDPLDLLRSIGIDVKTVKRKRPLQETSADDEAR